MDKVICPYCGFIAHPLCSEGKTWKFVCERCKAIFIAAPRGNSNR